MQLAELMHKSLKEVRDLPASEVTLWLAYFKIKEDLKEDKPEESKDTITQFKELVGGAKSDTNET